MWHCEFLVISWFSGWSSVRGQTVTCDCGSICYQYFFWLNNDSPDAFLGPPPAAEKATKVITPILEVISSNISQSNFPKKSQSPNHQSVYRTVLFISNVKCCHPLDPDELLNCGLVRATLNSWLGVEIPVISVARWKFLILKGTDKRNDQLVLLSTFKKN